MIGVSKPYRPQQVFRRIVSEFRAPAASFASLQLN
jgi:hypothetical protein